MTTATEKMAQWHDDHAKAFPPGSSWRRIHEESARQLRDQRPEDPVFKGVRYAMRLARNNAFDAAIELCDMMSGCTGTECAEKIRKLQEELNGHEG